ncbi:hypothetical protein AX15_002080 [Amanita polypyramis BW_CC]|nr:hypothetical protein AX15_002080 [Amanita polypyramis BW_CC]
MTTSATGPALSRPTLDYVDIPPAATLLQSTIPLHRSLRPAPRITTSLPKSSPPPSPTTARQRSTSSVASPSLSILPQLLLSTTLPGGTSLLGSTTGGSTGASTPAFVSASGGSGLGIQTGLDSSTNAAPGRKHLYDQALVQLLSTKDPLSVPIMSANFRRFVSCVGPVFWLQDRVEEIIMWKRGWKVTCVWLAAYGFFCYFPQLLLCLPHITLIAVILAMYPYPTPSVKDSGAMGIFSITPDQPPPPEASVPWQANIQGIQNLMGAFSDFMDLVKPYTYHLYLTPAHLYAFTHTTESSPLPLHTSTPLNSNPSLSTPSYSPPPPGSAFNQSTISDSTSTSAFDTSTPSSRPAMTAQYLVKRSSPYTPYILFFLVTTLPVLAYIVSLPYFPLRLVMFLVGAIPIVGLHPWVMNVFLPTMVLVGRKLWNEPVPGAVVDVMKRVKGVWGTGRARWGVGRWRLLRGWDPRNAQLDHSVVEGETNENENGNGGDPGEDETGNDNDELILGKSRYAGLKTLIQRIIDNDRLPDACWNADLREVELWENERYAGPMSAESISASASFDSSIGVGISGTGMRRPSLASLTSLANTTTTAGTATGTGLGSSTSPQKSWSKGGVTGRGSWSKANLRLSERRAWARRRDGDRWSESGGKESVDAEGEISSALTFPLAPGWSFVHTEDWRKDVTAEWAVEDCGAGCGDEDGWVYTNDAWLDMKRSPAPSLVLDEGEEAGGGPYVTRRRRWVRRVWYDPVHTRMSDA